MAMTLGELEARYAGESPHFRAGVQAAAKLPPMSRVTSRRVAAILHRQIAADAERAAQENRTKGQPGAA